MQFNIQSLVWHLWKIATFIAISDTVTAQGYVYEKLENVHGDSFVNNQPWSSTDLDESHRFTNYPNQIFNKTPSHQKQIPENPFKVLNEWKYLDFEYPTYESRQAAIANREFIPENNNPFGIDFYNNRIFVTIPRWYDGVPASFGTLPYPPTERSPPVRPYPNWEANSNPYAIDCNKLVSVFRTSIDNCGRMWVLDSGVLYAIFNLTQICPPKILAYDLSTDERLLSFEFPPDQVKQDSLHSNILADVRNGQCNDAHIYVTDVWRFGIVVFSLAKNRSWRVTNYNINASPIPSDFNIYGLNFQWMDGALGMSLSPVIPGTNDRILYFHPMASYKEFVVSTAILQDESLWPAKNRDVAQYFRSIGDRGAQGQSSTSGIDRNGVMYYTLLHRDGVGCWDTAKAYTRSNLGLLTPPNLQINSMQKNQEALIQFPCNLKVDNDPNDQGIWVISNRMPTFLYSRLDYNEINFRILRASAKNAVTGTICDSRMPASSNSLSVATVQEGACF